MRIVSTHGTKAENELSEELQRLLNKYDLSKWIFTDMVRIDSTTISHSHPVLTLNTRRVGNDAQVLASFLHEQIHWFLSGQQPSVDEAIQELRTFYRSVPASPPDGARDENSTYLHLIVNYLELQALTESLGAAEASAVIRERQPVFYRWIYEKVLSDTERIGEVVRRHRLELEDAGPG